MPDTPEQKRARRSAIRASSNRVCECGCGGKTMPDKRFVRGHSYVKGRLTRFRIEDRGYKTPCHVWVGQLNRNGYGVCCVKGYQTYLAHRITYEQKYGPIPRGLEPDHLCRVPACINAEHLEPVTRAVNVRRGKSCKLTSDDVQKIRSMYIPKVTRQGDIAKQFGVSQHAIWCVVNNRTWITM
jgi:hypothetical protein